MTYEQLSQIRVGQSIDFWQAGDGTKLRFKVVAIHFNVDREGVPTRALETESIRVTARLGDTPGSIVERHLFAVQGDSTSSHESVTFS